MVRPAPQGTLQWTLDLLNRPVYGAAGVLRAGARGENLLEGFTSGLYVDEPEDRLLVGDVLESDYGLSPALAHTLGFAAEVMNPADPVNYIGGKTIVIPAKAAAGYAGSLAGRVLPEAVTRAAGRTADTAVDTMRRLFVGKPTTEPVLRAVEDAEVVQRRLRETLKPEVEAVAPLIRKVEKESSPERAADVMELFGTVREPELGKISETEKALGMDWSTRSRAIHDIISGDFGYDLGDVTEVSELNYLSHPLTDEIKDTVYGVFGRPKAKSGGGQEALESWMTSKTGLRRGRTMKLVDDAGNVIEENPTIRQVNEAAVEGKNVRLRIPGGDIPIRGKKVFEDNPRKILESYVPKISKAVGGKEFEDIISAIGRETAQSADDIKYQDKYYSPEIAKDIARASVNRADPAHIKRVGRVFDKAMQWWKAEKLFMVPAYHLRNVAGNFWNNSLASQNFAKDAPAWVSAYKDAGSTLKSVARGTADKATRRLYDEMVERGVIHDSTWTSDMVEAASKSDITLNPLSPKFVGFQWGARAGQSLEDWGRAAHYLWARKHKGMDPREAARSVKKHLFDYGELTDTEKKIKKIVPFYTWQRKNIPLQLENMAKIPSRYRTLGLASMEGTGATGEENYAGLPPWTREGLPFPLPFAGEGEQRFTDLMSYLPIGDPVQTGGDPLRSILSSMGPLSSAIDIVSGQSTFSGAPLERYPGETLNLFGMDTPIPRRYGAPALQQSRMLSMLDRMMSEPRYAGARDEGIADLAYRLLVGRTEVASEESATNNVQRLIAQGKNAISKARRVMREGDRADAERLRDQARRFFEQARELQQIAGGR